MAECSELVNAAIADWVKKLATHATHVTDDSLI